MIPLFAATSAISTVDRVGTAALSQWKHLAGGQATDAKQTDAASSDSFGALLAAHGVASSSGPAKPGPVNSGATLPPQSGS
jgi:hypothetical protein